MSNQELIYAYRNLYRTGLQAVMYSKPARFVVRDKLREAFRYGKAGDYDAEAVRRTVRFLRSAARERGLAHRVVKNLVLAAWHRQNVATQSYEWVLRTAAKDGQKRNFIKETAYVHYERTIDMLNRTMGLCLR